MSVSIDDMSKDWSADLTNRIATEVKRLRGKRSGQWLADRTQELGYAISRTTISELENGKRKYVTVAELVVLARALNTAPLALIYPEPFEAAVEVLPGVSAPGSTALQWFAGETAMEPWHDSVDPDWQDFQANLGELWTSHQLSDLKIRRDSLIAMAAAAPEDQKADAIDRANTLQMLMTIMEAGRRQRVGQGGTDGG